MRRLIYLDLFAGIGGFALGAWWAGMRFDEHYFSEIDPYCVELYGRRFPEAIALGDITQHETWELPDADYIITGGFPCQDISAAGKGAGLAGDRSGLWFAMLEVIGRVRPRFVVVENVSAITTRGLGVVLGGLSEIGYDAEWQAIRAADVGAPHRRERIWIVAYPHGAGVRDAEQRAPRGRLDLQDRRCAEPFDDGAAGDVPNSDRAGLGERRRPEPVRAKLDTAERAGEDVPDADGRRFGIEREPEYGELEGAPGGLADRCDSGRRRERADVADTEVVSERSRLREGEPAGERRRRSGDGGSAVRDSDSEYCDGRGSAGLAREARLAAGREGFRGYWATEPDVGRCLDGLSAWLDGFGMDASHNSVLAYVDEAETGTGEVLRALRHSIETQILRWQTGGFVSLSSTTILLAYVCKLQERYSHEAWLQSEGAAAFEDIVRSVRSGVEPDGTSCGSGQGEQYAREYPDIMQALSRLLARDAEAAWLEYRRSNAVTRMGWETGIGRIASGVSHRVDRLRGLGNAIVPQIAALLFERIMTTEENRAR